VGVLPPTGLILPLNFIGDTRNSFSGLLLGARFWEVDLQPSDIKKAALGGPLMKICQSKEDCIGDMELINGLGSVVRDRSGDRAGHIVNGTWEAVPSEVASNIVAPEVEEIPNKVTLVGVWTRNGSGDADKYGKSEKEVGIARTHLIVITFCSVFLKTSNLNLILFFQNV
jgi:hypothetical protein